VLSDHFSMSFPVPLWSRIEFTQAPVIMRCPPGWRWESGPLPDADFWLVLEGRGELRAAGRDYPLAPGVALWLRPGDQPQASQDASDPLLVFFFHFRLHGVPPTTAASEAPRARTLRRLGLAETWARTATAGSTAADPLAHRQGCLAAETLLLEWLRSQPGADSSDTSGRLEELIAAIGREPERLWTLEAMARRVRLSPPQFTRLFRRHTGQPPMRFVIAARLNHARHWLSATRLTVSEIADALGYTDVFFFSRQFKRHVGLGPLAWRRAAASKVSPSRR
jgi:AraC family transcriptional regulator, arabinose operon regulatory protein